MRYSGSSSLVATRFVRDAEQAGWEARLRASTNRRRTSVAHGGLGEGVPLRTAEPLHASVGNAELPIVPVDDDVKAAHQSLSMLVGIGWRVQPGRLPTSADVRQRRRLPSLLPATVARRTNWIEEGLLTLLDHKPVSGCSRWTSSYRRRVGWTSRGGSSIHTCNSASSTPLTSGTCARWARPTLAGSHSRHWKSSRLSRPPQARRAHTGEVAGLAVRAGLVTSPGATAFVGLRGGGGNVRTATNRQPDRVGGSSPLIRRSRKYAVST